MNEKFKTEVEASCQSEQAQIAQWTNQNVLKHRTGAMCRNPAITAKRGKRATGVKRGKTGKRCQGRENAYAKSRLFILIG